MGVMHGTLGIVENVSNIYHMAGTAYSMRQTWKMAHPVVARRPAL